MVVKLIKEELSLQLGELMMVSMSLTTTQIQKSENNRTQTIFWLINEGQNPGLNNPHESHPEIVNVVSTFQLNTKLDLRKIVQKARNAEYNPKRFAGAIMRISNPKSIALIFQTGKILYRYKINRRN